MSTVTRQRILPERDALIEDLTFMADTGETLRGALDRLGVCANTLDKALERAGRIDLRQRLVANAEHRGAA